MGEYKKPMVTIELDEYNQLLESSDPKELDKYKYAMSLIFTRINNSDYRLGKAERAIANIADIIDLLKEANLEIFLERHKDFLEVKDLKLKK